MSANIHPLLSYLHWNRNLTFYVNIPNSPHFHSVCMNNVLDVWVYMYVDMYTCVCVCVCMGLYVCRYVSEFLISFEAWTKLAQT